VKRGYRATRSKLPLRKVALVSLLFAHSPITVSPFGTQILPRRRRRRRREEEKGGERGGRRRKRKKRVPFPFISS